MNLPGTPLQKDTRPMCARCGSRSSCLAQYCVFEDTWESYQIRRA